MNWLPHSNTVQHISLPLELLGLFLVLLEIYYPRHANQLEALIDEKRRWAMEHVRLALVESFWPSDIGVRMRPFMMAFLIVLASLILWLHLLIAEKHALPWWLLPCWTGVGGLGLRQSKLSPYWQLRMVEYSLFLAALPFVLFIGFLSIVLLFIVSYPFMMLDRIGRGHATGGLGLILGAIGLLGEGYQVIMIDKDWDAKTVTEIWAVYATIVIALGMVAFFVHRAVKRNTA